MMNVRFGLNLWNYIYRYTDGDIDLLRRTAEKGFSAAEIPVEETDISGALLAKTARELGIELTLCAVMKKGRDMSSFDSEVRKSTLNYLSECCRIGGEAGAKLLCGPLYAGGGKARLLSQEDRRRETELAAEGLYKLSHVAADNGMLLAIEPLSRYKTSVVNTVGQAIELCDLAGADNVGIHVDTFQSNIEQTGAASAVLQAAESGKLMHVHACENNRGAPGTGTMPWKEIFSVLRQYDYRGHVTMETFLPGGFDAPWTPPVLSPDETAFTGLRFMKEMLQDVLS